MLNEHDDTLSELGLSTFRNRPDIVGFGDNLSGRSRPSNFPKKKGLPQTCLTL